MRWLLLGLCAWFGCTAGEGPRAREGAEAGAATQAAAPAEAKAVAGEQAAPGAREDEERQPAMTPVRPRTWEEYRALEQPLRCAREVRCGEIGASDRERCLRDGRRRADVVLGVERGLAAGRYRFDPGPAAECLRVLAEAPCHVDYESVPAGCLSGAVPSGLAPAVPPGGACERWEECIDGICGGDFGCVGTCRARTMTVGGACGSDTLCAEELFCERDQCQTRGDVGSKCSGHWQACKPTLQCRGYVPASDNREWPSPARPGTCERRLGVGEPCKRVSLWDDCAQELFCDFGAAAPTCRTRLPAGASCTWMNACGEGLICDGIVLGDQAAANGSGMWAVAKAGVCRPFGDHGSACDPKAAATVCPAMHRCDEATRTCVRRGFTGDPCRTLNDCQPYHYCESKRRTCAPQAGLGEACVPPRKDDSLDGPCFLSTCDRARRRCADRCGK